MNRMHPERWVPLVFLVLGGLLAPAAVSAQAGTSPEEDSWGVSSPQSSSATDESGKARGEERRGEFSVQGGLGFTADPDSFLLEFEGSYSPGGGVSFGPALQLGMEDDFVLVSPSVFTRYSFDLSKVTSKPLRPLSPYLQGGVGFTYIDRHRRRRDRDDIGFLMNLGFGADYAVTEKVSMGSRMLFNILPDDVENENFYFSWQVAAIRYRF